MTPNYKLDGMLELRKFLWKRLVDLNIFNETYEDYNNIALPYINAILNKNTKWINNILFNGSE